MPAKKTPAQLQREIDEVLATPLVLHGDRWISQKEAAARGAFDPKLYEKAVAEGRVPPAVATRVAKAAERSHAKPSHATMQRHFVYRVDQDPRISKELRGKSVVYLGEKELPAGGGMMARVALLRSDGSAGDEYLVREHHLSKV